MHLLSTECARDPLQPSVQITRTLQASQIRGRVVGASLLCFTVDPAFSCLYFLLGKERHNNQWPAGSDRWSDFGGRSGGAQETPEDTAAREFFEETLAVVQYFPDDPLPRRGWEDIAESLRQQEYVLRLTVGNHQRQFVLFVRQIPWDPDTVSRFASYRSALTCPRQVLSESWHEVVECHPAVRVSAHGLHTVRKEFLEKKTLGLWSVPQLRRAMENGGVMSQRNGYPEHCRAAFLESLELVLEEMAFQDPYFFREM